MKPTHNWISHSLLSLTLFAIVSLGQPSHSEGAACCMSAAVNGVGRLKNWEKLAFGLRTTVLGGVGYWDLKGQWQAHSDYDDVEWRSEVWGLFGINRKASMFFRIPWSINYRRASSLIDWGGFVSDIQLGGRYEILSIGELLHVPAIAFNLSVTAPTGRGTHQTTHVLAADVTSRGAWVLNAGFAFEKTFYPGFVRWDTGVQIPLPQYRDDIEQHQRFGVSFVNTLSGGIEIADVLVLAALVTLLWEDSLRINDVVQENSHRLDLSMGLSMAWSFHPHWSLIASINTGVFAGQMGFNQMGRITGSLNLRYGYF